MSYNNHEQTISLLYPLIYVINKWISWKIMFIAFSLWTIYIIICILCICYHDVDKILILGLFSCDINLTTNELNISTYASWHRSKLLSHYSLVHCSTTIHEHISQLLYVPIGHGAILFFWRNCITFEYCFMLCVTIVLSTPDLFELVKVQAN